MTDRNIASGREITELDCAGLLCPLPVYKAALVLRQLQSGDRLRVITTDPGALEDIPAMTRQRGDTLVSVDDAGDRQTFIIEKGDQQ
ncbi:MAG: sulfurtransferase TusA family protein [Acidimicrobiia bacterium]